MSGRKEPTPCPYTREETRKMYPTPPPAPPRVKELNK